MEIENIKAEFTDYSDIISKVGINKIMERFTSILNIYKKFAIQADFVDGEDIILNERVLMHAILDYFTDITRLKNFHDIEQINQDKIIAYEVSWFLKRKPIQVLKYSNEALIYVNEKFLLGILANHLLMDKKDEISKNKIINSYCDMLFYYLKFRNCDAKVLEIIISSFKAGNSVDKIEYE